MFVAPHNNAIFIIIYVQHNTTNTFKQHYSAIKRVIIVAAHRNNEDQPFLGTIYRLVSLPLPLPKLAIIYLYSYVNYNLISEIR